MKRVLLFIFGSLLLSQTGVLAQGKFSGYMFGDYYYNFKQVVPAGEAASKAAPGGTAFQAFQIRRIYFAYDDNLSDKFTTRFRLEADPSATLIGSKIGVMVKDAYIAWKNIFEGSNLVFGISPSPTFDASEGAWGHRALEKTIMDLRGIAPSRDFGLSLKGKLTGDGLFNYWVMFANGKGQSPETDKYKRYYGQISIKPSGNFWGMVNFDFEDRAQVTDPTGKKVSNGTTTMSAFVTYAQKDVFSLGLEGFTQSTANGYLSGGSLTSKSSLGVSAWATVNFNPDCQVVLRYDNFDPNTNSNAKGDARNLIIGGIDWKADKNVHIEPNIYYETYEAPTGGSAPDASVAGRLTVYWIFL